MHAVDLLDTSGAGFGALGIASNGPGGLSIGSGRGGIHCSNGGRSGRSGRSGGGGSAGGGGGGPSVLGVFGAVPLLSGSTSGTTTPLLLGFAHNSGVQRSTTRTTIIKITHSAVS